MVLRFSPLMYLSSWTKSSPTVGWENLVAFNGFLTYRILKIVTSFWGYLKYIVYYEPPNTIVEQETQITRAQAVASINGALYLEKVVVILHIIKNGKTSFYCR